MTSEMDKQLMMDVDISMVTSAHPSGLHDTKLLQKVEPSRVHGQGDFEPALLVSYHSEPRINRVGICRFSLFI